MKKLVIALIKCDEDSWDWAILLPRGGIVHSHDLTDSGYYTRKADAKRGAERFCCRIFDAIEESGTVGIDWREI